MWSVARRPKWIAMLALALAVAGAFAALGQWQLERSINSGASVERETETVRPLTEVAEPQSSFSEAVGGQLVSVEGEFAADNFVVLSGRMNDGSEGYWVVGRHLTKGGASLAVALGWAPTAGAAASAAQDLGGGPTTVTGRYLPSEAPQDSDFENGELSAMSTAALINVWPHFRGDVYSGYVVSGVAPAGLERIDSPSPTAEIAVNWLNIFYAAEWVVFAGFAIFMWWRLVKDAWEREVQLAEEAR
ncbi:MAG: hypothetical protein JWL94_761 [Microbacteriaceae bacterium]|jgi:surfeit locus 1 family protein|nr:hypothetical protein [Microbacteriaceae bacterium]HEV7956412.1 SURF1 family cytochrome oxidase biogenesis protein [Marisediminicola sp.]